MSDEFARSLLEWGMEIGSDPGGEVIAVDCRPCATTHAAVIGVENAYSHGTIVPELIAMAVNGRLGSTIESAVVASGVPCKFVHSTFFEGTRTQNAPPADGRHDIAAVVITDSGDTEHPMNMLSRITKRPIVYIDVPENIARHSMRKLGMPASLVEGLLRHASTQGRSAV